jgi:hypothetical protein
MPMATSRTPEGLEHVGEFAFAVMERAADAARGSARL